MRTWLISRFNLKTRKGRYSIAALMMCSFLVLGGASSCDGNETDASRRQDVQQREDVFNRAEDVVPVFEPQNFPLRRALVEFAQRQDEINHPWYIYLYSMTGEPIGYYVGQTYPISSCNFLSSSQAMVDKPNDNDNVPDFVLDAPSLDGMYYGGAGSSAACESMFFFDATTDAMITFSSPYWTATDQPSTTFKGPALGQTSVEDINEGTPVATQEPLPTVVPTETPEG